MKIVNVKLTQKGADTIRAIKDAEAGVVEVAQQPNMPGWGYELKKASEKLVSAWAQLKE